MRIAFAHDSIDTEGGVEAYLQAVILELRSRGHHIAMVYQQRGSASQTRSTTLRSIAHLALGVEERGLTAVVADLRDWRPDVCYSHNMAALDVDRALTGRWPVVKMLHGFFGTCASGLKMHAFPSAKACHRVFGPACLALYVPRRCGQLTAGALFRGYRWAAAQRRLFSKYAKVVVASRYMGEEVAKHGVSHGRISVLPLFSTIKIDLAPRAGEPDTILFAGRMTSLKGGHVLVSAVASAARRLGRPVRLVMAGDGPQKEEWRQLAASLGVQAEMTGWITLEDRWRVYQRAQLVAVPSLWPEPFGLVGLDAAALGRPAIAFDVGGIREWLTNGVNGRLVDPAAGASGLARAIADLLDGPAERCRLGTAAIDVARRMSVAAHADRLEGVLHAAIAR